MTTEVKPLTEAEAISAHMKDRDDYLAALRERGLIAPEPDAIDRLRDALEAIHGITLDRDKMARVCREARMELRPPLTRERVREALLTVWGAPAWAEAYAPRLHAALTEPQP